MSDEQRKWKIVDKQDGRGFGCYLTESIKKGTILGDAHYLFNHLAIAITELGSMTNHSYTPTCNAYMVHNRYEVKTLKDLSKGTELTINYLDYQLTPNIEQPQPHWD